MDDKDAILARLEILRQEHRDLDEAILALETAAHRDELQLRRLKKRKLTLKDRIITISDKFDPDIIA